ncbi:MAG: DUF5723 family protein [Bacteroidales bacterium]|nr:DUF5723 family protein [Bacteroidales bacterium]
MKIIITIYFFLIIHFVLNGQDMFGVANSNYAGIYGIHLNPASMVGSKLYMDYNLVSLNMFGESNYMLIEKGDFVDLLFNWVVPVYYTKENEERNFTIFRNKEYYKGTQSVRIVGPGAMVVDGKHAYGLHTSFRANSFFNNLPQDIGIFIYEAIDFDDQQQIPWSHDKPIRSGSMSWIEIDLSYAYNFHRYKWDSWSIGISLKPLLGISGFYTNLNNVDYYVQHDDTAYIDNLDFNYMYSLPVNYDDNSYESPLIRGFGFGVDLGVTYMYTTKGHSTKYYDQLCAQRYDDYNYKIGLSILDLGYIRFSKYAELHDFANAETDWYRSNDTLPSGSVNEINYKLESYFSDYYGQSLTDDKFSLYTPLAISLQFDYHPKRFIYLNGTLIYGIALGKNVLKRPTILAITPRYESARWEVAIPISLVEWHIAQPRLGFAFRFGNFFLGTEDITSVIGIKDFSGFDFYFGLRLNLTNNFRMNYIKENCGGRKIRNIETFDYRNF